MVWEGWCVVLAAVYNSTVPQLATLSSNLFSASFSFLDVSWSEARTLHLEPFQANLLLVVLTILAANIGFILIAWRVYGERIVQCFTSPDIQDILDVSSRQSFPKEYCPKY